MSETLYVRYEDGAYPVKVAGESYTVERPEGALVFQSKRSALKAITGTSDARNWTWDRYFRLGKFQTEIARSTTQSVVSLFDLFSPAPEKITTSVGDVPVRALNVNTRSKDRTGMGIDLVKRGHEVRKLLFAGFGGKIRSAGYDPDDVLQEVYKGILIRNAGACPFDVSKAGFGHYTHLVISCVLSNYHRKMVRQRKVEPVADEGDELLMEQHAGGGFADEDVITDDFKGALENETPWSQTETLESRVYPLLRAGYGRSEIADQLGLPKAAVTKALSTIREKYREWAE